MKASGYRALIAGFCLVHGLSARAQEHPYLSKFSLTEGFGTISLNWTLIAGNTCTGTKVERSTNGTDFSTVHEILGICGNISSPVPYAWIDPAPPEFSTVYYRLQLGVNGTSSVQSLGFEQLITSEQRAYPVPATTEVTIALRLPRQVIVDLRLYDARGTIVLERLEMSGPVHTLSLAALTAGVYLYDVDHDGRHFVGRLVKD